MVSVEVQKIQRGCPNSGFDSRGVVVEFIADGETRERRFNAAHLIDTLQAAGLDASEVAPPRAGRARLYVTKPWGMVEEKDVYHVFQNTEGVDVTPISLA
ncbi:MAG: hypothetical protein ACJ8C4_10655 [Gemmataceae bacterium]